MAAKAWGRHEVASVDDEAYKADSAYQMAPDVHAFIVHHEEGPQNLSFGVETNPIACPDVLIIELKGWHLLLRAYERNLREDFFLEALGLCLLQWLELCSLLLLLCLLCLSVRSDVLRLMRLTSLLVRRHRCLRALLFILRPLLSGLLRDALVLLISYESLEQSIACRLRLL